MSFNSTFDITKSGYYIEINKKQFQHPDGNFKTKEEAQDFVNYLIERVLEQYNKLLNLEQLTSKHQQLRNGYKIKAAEDLESDSK